MLSGCHILVVEDEALIALELASVLEDEGAIVVGPAQTIAAAFLLVGSAQMDCALLDINLRGEKSFAVADALSKIGVPYAFLTGYADNVIPDRYRDRPTIQKPVSLPTMMATVAALCSQATLKANRD